MTVSEHDPAAPVRHRVWGLVAKILGGCLLLLAGFLFLAFVIDVLSSDSAVMKNVVGNVLLFVVLVGASSLFGIALLRWGRRQRVGGSVKSRSGSTEWKRLRSTSVRRSAWSEWTRDHSQMVGGAFFVLVLLALSVFSTLVILPEEIRYVSGSETVSGTMVRMVRTVCDDASCYGNAEVQFQTTDGQSITEVVVVDLDATPGDPIPVTYLRDDPLAVRHFGPSLANTVVAVVTGPILALGVVGYVTWFVRRQRR